MAHELALQETYNKKRHTPGSHPILAYLPAAVDDEELSLDNEFMVEWPRLDCPAGDREDAGSTGCPLPRHTGGKPHIIKLESRGQQHEPSAYPIFA